MDKKKYSEFDRKLISSIKSNCKPNVQSNKGDKHNSSYVDGLSFGKFDSTILTTFETEQNITNSLFDHFLFHIHRLELIYKGLVSSGNDQSNSLIQYGRQSTINSSFINDTNDSKFLVINCFSMWVCNNTRTQDFHQEVDATYTMIGVPSNIENDKDTHSKIYKFQFRWTPIDNPLGNGHTMVYHYFIMV